MILGAPAYGWFFFQFDLHAMLSNNVGPVEDTCENRKEESHLLFTSETGSNVIVIDAAVNKLCNLQCAVGWYHEQHGDKAAFSCAPNTADRASREGIPTYPITCARAFAIHAMEFLLHHIRKNILYHIASIIVLELA